MKADKTTAISLLGTLTCYETMLSARLAVIQALRESYGKLDKEVTGQQKAGADAPIRL